MPNRTTIEAVTARALRLVAPVVAAAFLAACSSTFTPPPGEAFDEARIERDRAACEAVAAQENPLADTGLSFLGGAVWGAASGASFGLIHGGVGTGEGAAVGAGVGAVAGLIYGIAAGNQDVENAMSHCMTARGYRFTLSSRP